MQVDSIVSTRLIYRTCSTCFVILVKWRKI